MTPERIDEPDIVEKMSDELGITKPEPPSSLNLREVLRALRVVRFLIIANTVLLVVAIVILLLGTD